MKIVGIALCLALVPLALGRAERRAFNVRDSIEMSTFSDPPRRSQDGRPNLSPNGQHFVVVTSKGLIPSNEIESTIWLFDREQVQIVLRSGGHADPIALARVRAVPAMRANDSYEPIISDLRWTPDSETLYFVGQNSKGQHRLSRVDLKGRRIHRLTPVGADVVRYAFQDDVVVYTSVSVRASDTKTRTSLYGAIDPVAISVTGKPIQSVLYPEAIDIPTPKIYELWSVREGHAARPVVNATNGALPDLAHYWNVLSISPNLRYAVQLRPVEQIPEEWRHYLPVSGFESWKLKPADSWTTAPENYNRPRQYVLVDLSTGKSSALIDGPFGDTLAYNEQSQVAWTRDGSRVLVTNTFLPLDGAGLAERTKRVYPCTVVAVDIPSRKSQCVVFSRNASIATTSNPKPLRLTNAEFLGQDEMKLHFEWWQDTRSQTELYRFQDGVWKLEDKTDPTVEKDSHPDVVSVKLKQDLNHPPALWASDAKTGKSVELWDPNPQLAKMAFGEASIYHWKDTTGFEWTAGLVKPVDYVAGRRYPLVIQTHGFEPSEFITDGEFTTAMAARPLASAGMVVLQVQTNYTHTGVITEVTDNVRGYESAIDQLASEGLIDPKRVGIVGFSRTSWYVESALIGHSSRYAAASINDGVDHSYMQDLLFEFNARPSEGETIYGAKPIGRGLDRWVELAPGFHLDRITTPLLITAITRGHILGEWELYSTLFRQGKPVDLMCIPDGQHILQKPLDRLASQQGSVDWFRFWLQDYERPSPEDGDQYVRWRRLREMQSHVASGVDQVH